MSWSPWSQQKEATLNFDPSYEYRLAGRQDARIRTEEYIQGYNQRDHSQDHGFGDFQNRTPNIPFNRLRDHDLRGGYYLMTDFEIAREMANDFYRRIVPVPNKLQSMLRANLAGDQSVPMPGSLVTGEWRPDIVMADPGWPIGLLVAPKYPEQRQNMPFPQSSNFF